MGFTSLRSETADGAQSGVIHAILTTLRIAGHIERDEKQECVLSEHMQHMHDSIKSMMAAITGPVTEPNAHTVSNTRLIDLDEAADIGLCRVEPILRLVNACKRWHPLWPTSLT